MLLHVFLGFYRGLSAKGYLFEICFLLFHGFIMDILNAEMIVLSFRWFFLVFLLCMLLRCLHKYQPLQTAVGLPMHTKEFSLALLVSEIFNTYYGIADKFLHIRLI